jgi:hypothetical protein
MKIVNSHLLHKTELLLTKLTRGCYFSSSRIDSVKFIERGIPDMEYSSNYASLREILLFREM